MMLNLWKAVTITVTLTSIMAAEIPSSSVLISSSFSKETDYQSTPLFFYKNDEESSVFGDESDVSSSADIVSSATVPSLSSSDFSNDGDLLDGLVAQLAASLLYQIDGTSSADENNFLISSYYDVTPSSVLKLTSSVISTQELPMIKSSSVVKSKSITSSAVSSEQLKPEVMSSKPFPTLITAFKPIELRLSSSPVATTPSVSVALYESDEAIASSFFDAILLHPSPTIQSTQDEMLTSTTSTPIQQFSLISTPVSSISSSIKPTHFSKPSITSSIPLKNEVFKSSSTLIPHFSFTSKFSPSISTIKPTITNKPPITSLKNDVFKSSSTSIPHFSFTSKFSPSISSTKPTITNQPPITTLKSEVFKSSSTSIPHFSFTSKFPPSTLSIKPTITNKLPIIPSSSSNYVSSLSTTPTKTFTAPMSTQAINYGPTLKPSASSSSTFLTSSSEVLNFQPEQSQLDKVSQLLNIKDLTLTRSNVSEATVDRIIQGLMDIIRPLNSNNNNQLVAASPATTETNLNLVLQSLNKQPENDDIEFHKPSTVKVPAAEENVPFKNTVFSSFIQPSQVVSTVIKASSNIPLDNVIINAIHAVVSSQNEQLKTPILPSSSVNNEVTTGRQPPETLWPLPSSWFINPTPTLLDQTSSTSWPVQNKVRPITDRPTTAVNKRPTFIKLTQKPSITTSTPEIFSFGEVRPIVLSSSADENKPTDADENSRLPIRNTTPTLGGQTFGSNTVQIKVKPPAPHHQLHHNHLVVNMVTPLPFNDISSADGLELGKPGGILIKPTQSSSWDGRPTTVPLRQSSSIQSTPELYDHLHSDHHAFSTYSSVFIRPTLSSSTVHRQTIFHTVVSFSDSHNDEEIDQIEAQTQPITSTTTTTTTTTTSKPSSSSTASTTRRTTTRKPSSFFSTTRRRRRPTTTTSTKVNRRPFRTRRTTTSSRRPIFRPAHDSPTTSTTTPKPLKVGQKIMAFGISMLPAALVAAIIGFPLAIAGKKKRSIGQTTSDLLLDEWQRIRHQIDEFSTRRH